MKGYKQLKDLRGKVVVITGASSGLGEQIAYNAASRGAIVVGCARNFTKLEKVMRTCEELSGQPAHIYTLDVSQPNQIDRVVAKIETEVGPIAVLVNSAGFGLMEEALKIERPVTEDMFRVNVLGLIYMTQNVALHMAERRCGAIINIASMAGKISTPKSSVYSATKAAVLGYSNSLRLELKPLGISVLTVNPGPIATNFFNIADKSGKYLDSLGNVVLDPVVVADKIMRTIGTNKREVNVPYIMELGHHVYQMFPHFGDFLTNGIFNKK